MSLAVNGFSSSGVERAGAQADEAALLHLRLSTGVASRPSQPLLHVHHGLLTLSKWKHAPSPQWREGGGEGGEGEREGREERGMEARRMDQQWPHHQ